MFNRVCIIVLDSVGIGAMPDAADFGDEGAHTLGNIYAQQGKLELPNLYALGLGHIEDARLPKSGKPTASYGRLAAKTRAKDTTSGHWELAGLIMEPPFATFTSFPEDLLMEWLQKAHDEGLWQLDDSGKMIWRSPNNDKPRECAKRIPMPVFSAVSASGNRPYGPPDFFPVPDQAFYKKLAGCGAEPHGLNLFLANCPASGTQIIDELGEAHMLTGAPIVYTSADSVFQVAAHEEIIPIETQYRICQLARELLVGDNIVGRVIARPFVGKPGAFTRTKNRRDYSVPPVGETILDALEAKGQHTLGIGKIDDIFCNKGVAHSNHTTNNTDGIDATIEALTSNHEDTIIFTNLVDFDMRYGHRNDVAGYAKALEYLDSRLPKILEALRSNDLLIITADHGCDPTTPTTDHTREYVPILAYGGQAVGLGTRHTFADVAATIYEALGHGAWGIGESFYKSIVG